MTEKKIEVEQELVNYIESLDYEVTARRDIIAFMLSNNMQADTDAFKRYQKEFNDFNAEFQIAKSELEKRYKIEPLSTWRLDYSDRMLTITRGFSKTGENNRCGCENI